MDDIRLAVGFLTHPKTKKLQRAIGAEGVLSIQHLWCFCATEPKRRTGDLEGMDVDDIEIAANWTGEPGMFVEAAVGVGFIDSDANSNAGSNAHAYRLHNFALRQPYVSNAPDRSGQAKMAAEIRWHREGRHSKPRETCPLCSSDADASLALPAAMLQQCPIPIPIPSTSTNSRSSSNSNSNTPSSASGIRPVEITQPSGNVIGQVRTVFAAWHALHPDQHMQPHNGLREWREAERRLTQDGCTVEDLCLAIRGIHNDPWEDRPKHLTLLNVVKDSAAVYRFKAMADPSTMDLAGNRDRKNAIAAQAWLKMKAEENEQEQ